MAMTKFKLGRVKSVARQPRLALKNYMLATIPPPPPSADYTPSAMASLRDVYLNDRLGDCVIAGGYHLEGVLTGNAGPVYLATDQQITADYSAIGGYVPGNPATDRGAELQTALNYWRQHGFSSGNKLAGYLAVNAADFNEVMAAIYLFENVYLGVELPDAWVDPEPSSDGFTWDVAGPPNPAQGHAIAGFAYNASGITISTWGMLGHLTKEALARYFTSASGGECWTVLGPEMIIKASAKAPNGFDWASLVADFDALGGTVPAPTPGPIPPGPIPPPTPAPAPSAYPTLNQWDAVCDDLLKIYKNALSRWAILNTKTAGEKLIKQVNP